MAKRIPNQLKRAILMGLSKTNDTLTSSQLAERVNADPELPENYQKRPKQLNFIMKQICKEFDGIEEVVLSRNGTSHHGTARFRMGFKSNLKQITVNLPEDCVEYIKAWRAKGVAAGRAVESLIRADIEANGMPEADGQRDE